MNIVIDHQDLVSREQFDAIVNGEARVEVIVHCDDGIDKLSAAVRVENGAPRGSLDVSKE